MWRADQWIMENHVKDAIPCRVLIFGSCKVTGEISGALKKNRVEVITIEQIMLKKEWKKVDAVIAVSDSDLDNLSLCSIGSKIYDLNNIISVCNHAENRKLYERAGVCLVDKGCMENRICMMITGKAS